MTAELLAIGTELLLGNIANTDAQFLSNELSALGINVFMHTVVGDNPARVRAAAEAAKSRADIIITTGGLGPTADDLTKENIAAAFGRKLVYHEPSAEKIKQIFREKNRVMTDNNLRQAYLPENCVVVENTCGTAPGCIIETEGKRVVMLPGPPHECEAMWFSGIKPYLQKLSDCCIVSRQLHVFGMGESRVESILSDMITNGENPTVAPYAKIGEVMLRVTARAASDAEGYKMCDERVNEIKRILGDIVYSVDIDTLEETVIGLLTRSKTTLAVAESCTGGALSKRLTDVAGASKAFLGGAVTYSPEAKTKLLGVPAELIRENGVVSEKVAMAMAKGARERFGADIGVGITGVAGPGPDEDGNPEGLVFIALSDKNGEYCQKPSIFGSTRDTIRHNSASHALDMVRRNLLKLS